MKYRVTGADRTTGQEMDRIIEAPDPETARGIGSRSMLVAEVEATSSSRAVVPPKLHSAQQADYVAPARTTPSYDDVVAGAKVLRIFAAVLFLAAALQMIGAVLRVAAAGVVGDAVLKDPVGTLINAGVSAAETVAAALLFRLLASLALAVRDMAQNSFRAR